MTAKTLNHAENWKHLARWNGQGFYDLRTEDFGDVPVRLFLTPNLLKEAEDILYRQIVNATRFPGVKLVIITPDTHYGYGVPVGCVLITDVDGGAIAMGPVGYDIGCGMMSARSTVPAELATPEKKLKFNRAVMERVEMGAGGKSHRFGELSKSEFNALVRGGAEFYVDKYGAAFDRSRAERHRIPVDDDWDIPWGGRGRPERGLNQLGSLGGGNYAILNRLIIFEQVSAAFKEVFRQELELVYEISHNLVQRELNPELGEVWVHRKGATRAFPAHHPSLVGTLWEETGHPVLIPGSNKDYSYILQPLPGAANSGYSVNHGAGRRLSRGEANRTLSQRKMDDEYK